MRRRLFTLRSAPLLLLLLCAGVAATVWWVRKPDGPSYEEVDLRGLTFFPLDPDRGTDADIPACWRRLDGRRVRLEGEMYAPFAPVAAVDRFELVHWRSGSGAPSRRPPRAQERVFARVPEGGPTVPNYQYHGEVQVYGTLHVGVKKAEGSIVSVYTLTVDRVEPPADLATAPRNATAFSPAHLAAVAVVTVPAVWWAVRRRRRTRRLVRYARGLCTHCGYDLTGNLSGTCPECGTQHRYPESP